MKFKNEKQKQNMIKQGHKTNTKKQKKTNKRQTTENIIKANKIIKTN